MPFTVYDGLIKALQLDSFGTLGIEVILSALTPLFLATASAIQAVTGFVVGSPVVGYSSAGYPIHYGFGKRLVSVVTLYVSKGHYYRVEYVLFVLWLYPVRKA